MARRILGLAVLILTTGLLVPTSAVGQAPGGDIESDKLNPGNFTGRLKGAVSPGSDFELSIEIPRLEINQKALQGANRGNQNQMRQLAQAQQQIARAQQQMQRARNPQEQARAMQQMQRTMQQLQQNQLRQMIQQQRNAGGNNGAVKIVTDTKDISFHAAPDLVVRLAQPPIGFDEKGNVQTPTPQLLKELKGSNPNLPGYEGKLEDLTAGALVQVVMKRAVVDPKEAAPAEHKNVVTMILVQQAGMATPQRGKK